MQDARSNLFDETMHKMCSAHQRNCDVSFCSCDARKVFPIVSGRGDLLTFKISWFPCGCKHSHMSVNAMEILYFINLFVAFFVFRAADHFPFVLLFVHLTSIFIANTILSK